MKILICGNTKLYQFYCPGCDDEILTSSPNTKQCPDCLTQLKQERTKVEYVTPPEQVRKKLSKSLRQLYVKNQNNKCFYCSREFDTMIQRNKKIYRLSVCFDHINPLVYSYNNNSDNFVASCKLCNAFKSSLAFENIDDIKEYLKTRWNRELENGKIIILEDSNDDQ